MYMVFTSPHGKTDFLQLYCYALKGNAPLYFVYFNRLNYIDTKNENYYRINYILQLLLHLYYKENLFASVCNCMLYDEHVQKCDF